MSMVQIGIGVMTPEQDEANRAEVQRLFKKPWRATCAECTGKMWFGDTETELKLLMQDHAELHVPAYRVWSKASEDGEKEAKAE